MAPNLSILDNCPRLLLDVPLKPIQGHRFQPTGFPDLGAATYQAGDTDCLLVESAQSMANRLEATIWDEGKDDLVSAAHGLSYVRVNGKDKSFLTASVLEAHRLNSVYIEKADGNEFHKMLTKEAKYSEKDPIDRGALVKALMRYDVNSLLHGTFLESIGGRLRLPRALSAFVEAEGVKVAASGGVKNDHVMPGKDADRGAKDGFGNVPFHREEYTARAIVAHFNLDLQQIRGYQLDERSRSLLVVLALYKIRALLDGNLRLRTACDFEVCSEATQGRIVCRRPEGFELPSLADLDGALRAVVQTCAGPMGGDKAVTTVTFTK